MKTRYFVYPMTLLAIAMATPASAQALGRATEEVQLEAPGVTLYGTMEIPAGAGRHPVALIIAGSGPTDRNGNSPLLPGSNNTLKMLAEALASNGIASVRYDKRAIAKSVAPGLTEASLRFTTYSDDAARWIDKLRADPRFDRVIVVGHSEGALLGTIAANAKHADGLVLMAGAGRPIGTVLREQLQAQMAPTYPVADSLLKELEAGRSIANVPPAMLSLFRPSIQPYMMSWLPLDPATELGRFDAPSLVLQGTTDRQVSVADGQRLGAASPRAKLVLVEGANHLFKQASGTIAEQAQSYSDPNLPIDTHAIDAIVTYIHQVAKAPARNAGKAPRSANR